MQDCYKWYGTVGPLYKGTTLKATQLSTTAKQNDLIQ